MYRVVAAVSARTRAPETLKVRDGEGSRSPLPVLVVRQVRGTCGALAVLVRGRVGSFEILGETEG